MSSRWKKSNRIFFDQQQQQYCTCTAGTRVISASRSKRNHTESDGAMAAATGAPCAGCTVIAERDTPTPNKGEVKIESMIKCEWVVEKCCFGRL